MSVLGIDQKLRRSFNKLKSYGGTDKEPDQNENTDSSIFLQTFLHHWDSCHQTFINFESDSTQVQDDVINVSAQLEQMIELLKHESGTCSTNSILDYILSENVLGELSAWTKSLPSSLVGSLINLQIDLYEILIMDKERGISLLSHQTILRPLISILELCEALGIDEIEAKLLNLIYDLSTLLIESPELIELFLSSSSTSKRLILFSLLTPNLHKTGLSGQRAREAVLIYISMSCKHKIVENLIAQSNFCLILATGLSALFSALPSSLDVDHPSWHKLDMSDCQMIPELDSMMTSFELCSAVVEISPVSISSQLLELILNGFLNPILGPALTSDTESEIIAYTAYLNFFLTEISADPLVVLIIRFLMTFSVDDKSIKDTLISRINSSSQVSVVTLSLFETILSFNLEDVMFGLIFQYLISCTYLLSSHRDKICYADPQGRAAFKFLSLVPVSCDPPETPVTPRRNPFSAASHPSPSRPLPPPGSEEPGCLDPSLGDPTSYPGAVYVGTSNYQQYIRTCRQIIRSTACDCLQWKNRYDGSDEFRRSIKTRATRQQSLGMKIERAGFILDSDLVHDNVQIIDNATGSGSLSGESSGYLSGNWELEAEEVTLSPEEETEFWSAVGGSEITKERLKTVLARIQHEDRLSLSSLCSDELSPRPSLPLELSPRPSLPLEDRPHLNDILHPSPSSSPSLGPFLTSLLTSVQNFEQNKLAFNLRVTAIISKLAAFPQPLLRCILTHPDIIVQPSCTTLIQAICTARSRLDSVMPGLLGAEEAVRQARQFLQDRLSPGKSMSTASITSLPASFGEYSRRGSKLLNMLGRRSNPLSLSNQRTQPVIPPHTHRMAMAAVLLEEWLQELAAIVQEHAIMEQQAAIMR